MEAQIVPSRSLAFTEQTADHASLDGMVIASIPAFTDASSRRKT
jgi:hypothetical protein